MLLLFNKSENLEWAQVVVYSDLGEIYQPSLSIGKSIVNL